MSQANSPWSMRTQHALKEENLGYCSLNTHVSSIWAANLSSVSQNQDIEARGKSRSSVFFLLPLVSATKIF